VISGDVANTGTGSNYERLNVVGNPSVSNPSPAQWFNKAAFAVPAPLTFGDLGRNALRGQKFWNLDTSLVREVPLGERRHLQFRADLFNIANHPVWGSPLSNYNDPQFGKILSTRSTPRQVQFAMKFQF
jgi:hypothetical protein